MYRMVMHGETEPDKALFYRLTDGENLSSRCHIFELPLKS